VTTNTIGFSTAGSEAMRIDSSGNLLVGTTDSDPNNNSTNTSADDGFAVTNNVLRVAKYNDNSAVFNRTGGDGAILGFRKSGTTIGSIGCYADKFYIGDGDTGICFVGEDDVILPCSPSSNNNRDDAITLGAAAVRFKDLYMSGGVYLGGTGAANKLDDYEEGTWLPSLGAASANPTVGYNAQVGHYTKIGNLVTVSCRIITNSRSGGSGHLLVRGLPFTVAAAEAYASATIGFNYNWNTPPQHAGAQANTVTVLLYQDGRTNAVSGSGDIAASGSSYLNLSCSYITNS
jgi:hypothetical protein